MVALSDMSREALVRELRLATGTGNYERGKRIKRELAQRHARVQGRPTVQPPAKPRSYVDD